MGAFEKGEIVTQRVTLWSNSGPLSDWDPWGSSCTSGMGMATSGPPILGDGGILYREPLNGPPECGLSPRWCSAHMV